MIRTSPIAFGSLLSSSVSSTGSEQVALQMELLLLKDLPPTSISFHMKNLSAANKAGELGVKGIL